MMKKIQMIAALVAVVAMVSSCAMVKSPLTGGLYTDVKAPIMATGNANATKVGSAEAVSILGWVATGDASIDAAAKSAGITKIHHIDEQGTSILGVYAKYQVYVYGE